MTLTNEQLVAFLAFGLLIMIEPDSLLVNMSSNELKEFAEEVNDLLSPFVEEAADMVDPVISILKEALQKAKGEV